MARGGDRSNKHIQTSKYYCGGILLAVLLFTLYVLLQSSAESMGNEQQQFGIEGAADNNNNEDEWIKREENHQLPSEDRGKIAITSSGDLSRTQQQAKGHRDKIGVFYPPQVPRIIRHAELLGGERVKYSGELAPYGLESGFRPPVQRGISIIPQPEDSITLDTIDPEIGKEVDNKWLPILVDADIVHVRNFSSGLSSKFIVHLEGGYKAAMKPVLDPEVCWNGTIHTWKTYDYFTLAKRYARRTGRMDQGMGEIAGYALDRALGFFRKPPIAGRLISSKVYFAYCAHEGDKRCQARLDQPEFFIPVAMVAWQKKLRYFTPKREVKKALMLEEDVEDLKVPLKEIIETADVLLFDLLSDDHDRKRDNGNWIKDMNGNIVFWDSGIAFEHGPQWREDKNITDSRSCYNVLCGPEHWRMMNAKNLDQDVTKEDVCEPKICKFSRDFVEKLQHFNSQTERENRLSGRWHAYLERDQLHPVFHLAAWWRYGRRSTLTRMRLTQDSFYRGMDRKVQLILDYVDGCAAKHGGMENILL